MSSWHDWFPFVTAMTGLFVGAAVTELHVVLASARERRRALNILLFDLLQLRFDVRTSNPRMLVEVLIKVARKKLGLNNAPTESQQALQAIISAVLAEVLRQDRTKLTERYVSTVQALAPHDAILAYRLSGRERLTGLENATQLYYAKVAQHPDILADPHAPAVIEVMQEETTAVFIDEVLKELAAEIERVARARSWWPFRLWTPRSVKQAIRNQDRRPTEETEKELEAQIDRLVPAVVSAVSASLQSRQAASQNCSHPDRTKPQ